MTSPLGAEEVSPLRSHAFRNDAAQREALLDAYFSETKLLHVLSEWLAARATAFKTTCTLPASPYPSLLRAVRRAEIERALVLDGVAVVVAAGDSATLTVPPVLLKHDGQQALARTGAASDARLQLCSTAMLAPLGLWSFAPVLQRLDVDVLAQRVAAIRAAHQHLPRTWFAASDADSDGDYCVTVFTALVDSGHHFALDALAIVELERHVVVTGELLEPALAVFARQLVKSLHDVSAAAAVTAASTASAVTSSASAAIGRCRLEITPPDDDVATQHCDAELQRSVWTSTSVLANRSAFASAVKLALVGNARFTITSFSVVEQAAPAIATAAPSARAPVTLVRTAQQFFFHFDAQSATNTQATVAAAVGRHQQHPRGSVAHEASRSFVAGTRVVDSGVFLDARGALEITTRVANGNVHTASAAGNRHKTSSTTAAAAPASQQTDTHASACTPSISHNEHPSSIVVERVLTTLAAIAPSAICHWTKCFAASVAFALLRLACSTQLLLDALAVADDSAASRALLGRHVDTLGSHLESLVARARVGATSSLVQSVAWQLVGLWRDARDSFSAATATRHDCEDDNGDGDAVDHRLSSSDSDNSDSAEQCVEALECVCELLLIVARSAVRDFVDLVASNTKHTQAVAADGADAQCIGVQRALQLALDTRLYPPLVAFETVFAQFIVDSSVDVAFESAVMNIVAFHLPPNPFVELSHKLRVFAIRQLVWTQPLASNAAAAAAASRRERIVVLNTHAARVNSRDSDDRTLVVLNRRLLEVLDAAHVRCALEWLQQQQVLPPRDYQPARGAYSVQLASSLVVFHPLAFATVTRRTTATPSEHAPSPRRLVRKLEVAELVVVEGSDAGQALECFADCVGRELQRLVTLPAAISSSSKDLNAATDAVERPRVCILGGPLGRVVSDVDMVTISDNAAVRQLVRDATLATCVPHVRLTIAGMDADAAVSTSRAVVHIVGVSFVFVHRRTAASSGVKHAQRPSNPPHPQLQALDTRCVAPLAAFRLQRYGVFLTHDSAAIARDVIDNMSATLSDAAAAAIPLTHWTPYARYALDAHDVLLEYELACGKSIVATASTLPPPPEQVRCSDATHKQMLQRLTLDAPILQLYAIEDASRWLLQRFTGALSPLQTNVSSLERLRSPLVRTLLSALVRDDVTQTLTRVNREMQYVDGLNDLVDALRMLCTATNKTPTVVASSSTAISRKNSAPERLLRRLWLTVRAMRFAMQRDFFASY